MMSQDVIGAAKSGPGRDDIPFPAGQGLALQALVDDLQPVTPIRPRDGLALAVAMALVSAFVVVVTKGVRNDLLLGAPHPMFFLRGATLLLVGAASAYAVMAGSRPEIGARDGRAMWRWVLLAALLFPVAALFNVATNMPGNADEARALFAPSVGAECLTLSGLCALAIGSAMVLWLRRGAPSDPRRAGLLVGLAAGGFGAAAYSLLCPMNGIVYIGTWYTLAVALCALAGRLVVPPLLRW